MDKSSISNNKQTEFPASYDYYNCCGYSKEKPNLTSNSTTTTTTTTTTSTTNINNFNQQEEEQQQQQPNNLTTTETHDKYDVIDSNDEKNNLASGVESKLHLNETANGCHEVITTTTTTPLNKKCESSSNVNIKCDLKQYVRPTTSSGIIAGTGGSSHHHMRKVSKTQSLDIVDKEGDEHIQDNELKLLSSVPESYTIKFTKQNLGGSELSETAVPAPGSLHTSSNVMYNDQMRPIYPNVPYSPYGSPIGSPRSNRRRAPLRESRRISIEQSGSFLQLNQYKLMDQIGQGSYGLVKLAYSEEDSTHYAMKILSKRRLLKKVGFMGRGPKRTTSPLDRVYREIAVLKKLDHPNVVKLVEVLDDPLEDSLYLVFELVQLGEILSIPTDQPLTESRAFSVLRDVVLGLEYLHYQKIIHGDIKPGNLLLGECGCVKIADLGVCNEFMGEDSFVNNRTTAGTPAFRAPETLIIGEHLYSGKATDIWALGITLYALVYGNVPYIADSVLAVYEKIKNDDLQFPSEPHISDDLKELIEQMLKKNPTERITLPQIKEHKWLTKYGTEPLPSEESNCRLIQINDDDINSVVKSIPKLDTLILIKTMLKKHSFQNPFTKNMPGRTTYRSGAKSERFSRSGRSNSAPEYQPNDRQMSSDNLLPSLAEGVTSTISFNDYSVLKNDDVKSK